MRPPPLVEAEAGSPAELAPVERLAVDPELAQIFQYEAPKFSTPATPSCSSCALILIIPGC
jgi:hypothetical protein